MQAARAPRNSTGTPRSRLKPWEVYRFYTCAHHKAGVDLNLFLELNVFSALGLDMSKDFGVWAHFCPPGPPDFCYNPEAKVRIAMDICSWETVQLEREAASPQRVLVAGTVRDPLDMVASAYCYHHAWNEWNNPTFEKPPLKVEFMDVHEGVDFMAKNMLEAVANMTSIHSQPHSDTYRIAYEAITRSSQDFDEEVTKLIDFWSQGLLTQRERDLALEAARTTDLHRHPDHQPANHTNDEECMAQARAATHTLQPEILAQYHEFQRRLGYEAPWALLSSCVQNAQPFGVLSLVLQCNVGVIAGYHLLARRYVAEGDDWKAYRLLQLALIYVFTLRNALKVPEEAARDWATRTDRIVGEIRILKDRLSSEQHRRYTKLPEANATLRISGLRIAIVSICAYPPGHPLILRNITPENRKAYGNHHGYEVFVHYEHPMPDKGVHIQHSKLQLVADYLRTGLYDWVAWFDCDSIIMNLNRTLDSVIHRYARRALRLAQKPTRSKTAKRPSEGREGPDEQQVTVDQSTYDGTFHAEEEPFEDEVLESFIGHVGSCNSDQGCILSKRIRVNPRTKYVATLRVAQIDMEQNSEKLSFIVLGGQSLGECNPRPESDFDCRLHSCFTDVEVPQAAVATGVVTLEAQAVRTHNDAWTFLEIATAAASTASVIQRRSLHMRVETDHTARFYYGAQAHAGTEGNEKADALANAGRTQGRNGGSNMVPPDTPPQDHTPTMSADTMVHAMKQAAADHFPYKERRAHTPWIKDHTLQLLAQARAAQAEGHEDWKTQRNKAKRAEGIESTGFMTNF
ncbi:phr [Symbiodinium natans]|uniref:Phr protein n=1 Tax=Symbiodinium natans TaxID=878477 RepID=A0A812KKQ3_9DINO|nr:phr [Symbiodinium natans]